MAELDSFLVKAEEAMDRANTLYADLGWDVIESKDNYTVSTMPTEVSLDALKVEYFFDKNPVAVCRYVFDHYVELVNQDHNEFEFYRIVRQYGPNAYGAHMRIRGSAIVSPREATTFTCFLQIAEHTAAFVTTSVDLPGAVIDEDSVTASIDYGLFLFEPVYGNPSKTHFVHVTRVDLKGAIPATLANIRLRSRGDQIKKLIDASISKA